MVRMFESCGWEYTVLRPIRQARDGAPVLLAARREYFGGGTTAVELKPLHVTRETVTSVKARLAEELRLSQHLRHRHIGEVLGFAADGEQPYLVHEHVPGCSLETVIDAAVLARRKLSAGFAVAVSRAVADALAHAHRDPLHIVHRAVSPANIQISQRGRVKLVNFGAAYSELMGRHPTPAGLLRGDAAYMAPEALSAFRPSRNRRHARARTPPDPRADLFSLGLVLLGTLTGWHPLDPPDVLEAELEPLLLPDTRAEMTPSIPLGIMAARLLHFGPKDVDRAARRLPARLRLIISKALQVDPSQRYQSALAMEEELRGFLSGSCPTYGEVEVAAEMARLLSAAKKLDAQVAYSVAGDGILPAPADLPRSFP
ncbi:protein kinase domain-containing protein [Hyalangium sp.]|uniref:protein kinase domain-containing protein n=1 Tax=Hyalangium sp. TaxID=2028555 RepID=UPI002D65E673|nr:protein kinase [Hyalangium sp.]HYH97754.1 protein kinase [Hyalangium sp.]